MTLRGLYEYVMKSITNKLKSEHPPEKGDTTANNAFTSMRSALVSPKIKPTPTLQPILPPPSTLLPPLSLDNITTTTTTTTTTTIPPTTTTTPKEENGGKN